LDVRLRCYEKNKIYNQYHLRLGRVFIAATFVVPTLVYLMLLLIGGWGLYFISSFLNNLTSFYSFGLNYLM
jgi:hypothetical protein